MKPFFVLSLALLVLFVSCNNLPVHQLHNKSWYTGDSNGHQNINYGSVILRGVSVDRSGGMDSIQSEINSLAPLLLWEQGLFPVCDAAAADYAADIRVYEREYMFQWRTKHSLALEFRLWNVEELESDGSALPSGEQLPLAAARVFAASNYSFSSSVILDRMLSQAIRNALKGFRPEINGRGPAVNVSQVADE